MIIRSASSRGVIVAGSRRHGKPSLWERIITTSVCDESRVTCHLSRSMMDPPLISCYCTYTVVVRLARPHSHTQELIQLYVESFDPTACTSALLRVLSWLC